MVTCAVTTVLSTAAAPGAAHRAARGRTQPATFRRIASSLAPQRHAAVKEVRSFASCIPCQFALCCRLVLSKKFPCMFLAAAGQGACLPRAQHWSRAQATLAHPLQTFALTRPLQTLHRATPATPRSGVCNHLAPTCSDLFHDCSSR